MKRLRYSAMAAMFGFAGWAPTAEACTCVTSADDPPPSVAESRREAVLVFTGKALAIRTNEEASYLGAPVPMTHFIVTFRVYSLWKGPIGTTAQVHFRSNPDSALCEYPFSVGSEYLVFAYGDEPTAEACDFTMELHDRESARVQADLGKARWESAR